MAYENVFLDPLPPNILDAEGRNALHLFIENDAQEDVPTQLDFKKRKLTSDGHEHFSLELYFKCNYCSQNYKNGGSITSGMKRHIENTHPNVLQGGVTTSRKTKLSPKALDSDDAHIKISRILHHYGNHLLFSTMNNSFTALHLAAMHFKPKILTALLHQCANKGKQGEFCFLVDNEGNTALHFACIWESKIRERKAARECIEILLQASCEPGLLIAMKNRMGWTALHYGVKSNNLSTVKMLLQYYDAERMAVNETVPILPFICGLNCESKTRIKILRQILKHEAQRVNDVFTKAQPNGVLISYTPLKIAVQNRQPKAVRELAKLGGLDLKWVDESGRTALFYAAMNGLSEKGNQCVLALFPKSRKFKGYDATNVLQDCDTDGKTVFDYAQTNCSNETMKTLMDTVLGASTRIKYDT